MRVDPPLKSQINETAAQTKLATVAAKILKRATYTPKMKLTIIKANTGGSGPRIIRNSRCSLDDRRCEHDKLGFNATKTCIAAWVCLQAHALIVKP
jgi:hypothetical protein